MAKTTKQPKELEPTEHQRRFVLMPDDMIPIEPGQAPPPRPELSEETKQRLRQKLRERKGNAG